MLKFSWIRGGLPLVALALAACADVPTAPLSPLPVPDPAAALAEVRCVATLAPRSVRCEPADGLASGLRAAITVGRQNVDAKLTSSNPQVVADTFQFDVTVTNLLPQVMGSTEFRMEGEGSYWVPDSAGIRVFFHAGPVVTEGSGVVTVENPAGIDAFTAGSQPYYLYDTVLEPDEESDPQTWKLRFTPGVTQFAFRMMITAAVPNPHGFVDVTPGPAVPLFVGGTRRLAASRYRFTGEAWPGATFTWSSDADSVATVSASGLVTAQGIGAATVQAEADSVAGVTRVVVCAPADVAPGDSIDAELTVDDCVSVGRDPLATGAYAADWYRITLAAGQQVTITQRIDGLGDAYLSVFDLDGAVLAQNDDFDDEGVYTTSSRLTFTAPRAGVYVIEASAFDTRTGDGVGTYRLIVQ